MRFMNTENNKDILIPVARFISIVFHPLFMPLYGLGIIYSAPTLLEYLPVGAKKILFLIVFINNVFIPVTLLPLLKNRNLISSYTIDERKERSIPLIMVCLLYLITSFIIFRYQIPGLLKSFVFSSTFLAVMVTVINFWWKISLHSVAAGALNALVVVLSVKMYSPLTGYLISSILTGGLILSSRLKLNSHNPAQVWIGFFTGFFGLSLFILLIQ